MVVFVGGSRGRRVSVRRWGMLRGARRRWRRVGRRRQRWGVRAWRSVGAGIFGLDRGLRWLARLTRRFIRRGRFIVRGGGGGGGGPVQGLGLF